MKRNCVPNLTIQEGLATPAPQLNGWSSTFEKIEVPQRVDYRQSRMSCIGQQIYTVVSFLPGQERMLDQILPVISSPDQYAQTLRISGQQRSVERITSDLVGAVCQFSQKAVVEPIIN